MLHRCNAYMHTHALHIHNYNTYMHIHICKLTTISMCLLLPTIAMSPGIGFALPIANRFPTTNLLTIVWGAIKNLTSRARNKRNAFWCRYRIHCFHGNLCLVLEPSQHNITTASMKQTGETWHEWTIVCNNSAPHPFGLGHFSCGLARGGGETWPTSTMWIGKSFCHPNGDQSGQGHLASGKTFISFHLCFADLWEYELQIHCW